MLEIFRKYQRYLFIVITFIVVISFSFFGTYSTIANNGYSDQIAFTTVDGTHVPRSELDQLVMFISTDAEDKLLLGGIWGPNFLNDGVIQKDFLKDGLAELIAAQYPGEINQDLQTRFEREKRYVPYEHPQAHFLSAETAWKYFAPDIKENYDALKASSNPSSPEAFAARVRLYNSQKKLPAITLRQALLYQQRQYEWLQPDPNLERTDLSLYGYHTLEDWFGPRFVRLVAEFIINSAAIAENQGYKVTRAEALADLKRNAEISYQQNLSNPHLGIANNAEYFNEQLHRMHLDQQQAADIWSKVLLFRRLFHDMGNSVFVDSLTFQTINQYSKESIEGEIFKLPSEFHLNDFRDLQKLQVYLNAISKASQNEKTALLMPDTFFSVDEVLKNYPELVQKRYLLDIAEADKKLLQTKISLKETWNWEVDDQNWPKLVKQFPDLGIKKGDTREQRYSILDGLDDITRGKIDAYANGQIFEMHPEWVDKALDEAPLVRTTVEINLKGGKTPFVGLENREQLIKQLDQAKLGEQDPGLRKFTANHSNFYRIVVIDKTPNKEILTFAEAQNSGILDQLLNAQLENYYQKIKSSRPQDFQNDDLTWKTFNEVKDQIADLYFAKLLDDIKHDQAQLAEKNSMPLVKETVISFRMNPYTRDILSKIKKDPQNLSKYVKSVTESTDKNKLTVREPLQNQWKFEKSPFHSDRGGNKQTLDFKEGFVLNPGQWSQVHTPVNGDIFFYQILKKGNDANEDALIAKIDEARKLLGNDAQESLGKHLLSVMKEKRAISLDYLNRGAEMTEE